MKRALVFSLVVLFGIGIAASGQLSGYWSTSIALDPDAVVIPDFFTSLNSTLKVDYVLSDWTFGSISTFDKAGFASQKFSVAGALGAFTLASGMAFDPAYITEATYNVQSPSLCPITWTATGVGPNFLTWDVTASVSIAGVGFEVYMLQDYSYADLLKVNYLLDASGEANVQTNSISYNTDANGMGYRLKLTGSFGGVSVTSFTYFNMWELDYDAFIGTFTYMPDRPVLGKSGYIWVDANCVFPFTEQYLLVEGFTFGCVTLDIGLSILCGGFADIEFLVTGISIGGWATFDFSIKFTEDTKTVATAIEIVMPAFDCITLELGFGSDVYGVVTDNVIDNVTIHGFKFATTWNGITFTSITELSASSKLMSSSVAYSYIYHSDVEGFLLPFVGKSLADAAVYNVIADDLWYAYCQATERFKLWEKFVIDVDADACCGGLFDLTITTFFGDHEELLWAGYATYLGTATAVNDTITLYGIAGDAYAYVARTAPTTARDAVSYKTVWAGGTDATLFNWAKTSVDLGVGVGANIALTFGFDISAFGWESLDVGFKWSF